MHMQKKALLLAGLIAGASALTGCTAVSKMAATPTPMAAQQQTAEPDAARETAAPSEAPDTQTAQSPVDLLVSGEKAAAGAIFEQEKLLLPLVETAEKLGWKAKSEQNEEEMQTKRVVTLEKDESRITVSWTVSDNTARNISWQKDGLLIPVDSYVTTMEDTVYVPAAFFEMAMDVRIAKRETTVMISTPKPNDTPKKEEDSTGENG